MDSTMIIQQGELAKYKVTFAREDFYPEQRDFHIELVYGMMGQVKTIEKSDCQMISNTVWLFSFDTSEMVGKVTARMVMEMSDGDVPTAARQEVDEQMICFIVSTPCPRFLTCPACASTGTHDVTYERTEESNIVTVYDVLADLYGRPIMTVNDEYILVLRADE